MLLPWRSVLRQLSRMLFKCRLGLQGSASSKSRKRRNGTIVGVANGSSRATDSAYFLAVFFICFLILMLSCQILVMRSEISEGKSHRSSSRSSSQGRAALRFGRQAIPFGRALSASQQLMNRNAAIVTNPNDNANTFMTAGVQWIQRLRLEQDRNYWIEQYWACFQGRAICPWQPVAGPDKGFVYSAYLDDSSPDNPKVRVIGVARTKKPEKAWCQLGWTTSANGTIHWSQVPAQIKAIREHWNLRYSAVFFLCPLKILSFRSPQFVSISTSQHPALPDYDLPRPTSTREEFNASYGHWAESPTGNLLPITYPPPRPEIRHELAVCVKPLHYNFSRVGQLVEFIEFNRLLGVTHFTFYNHSIGFQVDCVLRRYIDEGLVDVLPWHKLDVTSQKEIRTEGIFASLNDCLYRHMYDSAHLLMIDLDELIIPRTSKVITLTELLRAAVNSTTSGTKNIGAYYFRNAFFYLSWADDPEVNPSWKTDDIQLTSLQKTRRNVKLHPHRIRSKYIAKPRTVIEVGNHFIWEFRAGHVAAHVPDTMAIMHHYRTCEFGGETCLTNPSTQDRAAWKYGEALVEAVKKRFADFRPVCPAPEVVPSPIVPVDAKRIHRVLPV